METTTTSFNNKVPNLMILPQIVTFQHFGHWPLRSFFAVSAKGRQNEIHIIIIFIFFFLCLHCTVLFCPLLLDIYLWIFFQISQIPFEHSESTIDIPFKGVFDPLPGSVF
ncbi:hypothetical protein L1049_012623 [Liquidambar formosana]|uniref:Transmembrane protein n=1 Tax=Liquidambar formosana TaxID=63359 RepID=A0AAP0N5S8_LIQFO